MGNPADKLMTLIASPRDDSVSYYKGVVQQTQGSKAYVLIDGGSPLWCDAMDVKALDGDRVRVEVRKHKGTLVANYTHPVTDDAVANVANDKATKALSKVETLEVDALKADSAVIKNLQADTAKVHDLTADQLSAATAYVGELTAGEVTAQSIIADKAKLAQVDTDQLSADHATIGTISADYLKTSDMEAETARVDNLLAQKATVTDLNAATARIGDIEADYLVAADMTAEQARVGQLIAGKADVADLTAANARIDNLQSTKADISVLESDYITADAIDATYLHADMSNADVAWIQNGVIKDGSISNAMINSLSANKLTAGTINGETINVTNINADNITAGTINGQRIGEGSLSLDKLSEDVYTEQEVDNKLATMQAEIDGAIETWTGTAVPTLNNSPASSWNTSDERDRHVGDVYFVVNSQSEQNGYNYRFTKSGNTYSWQLIKDSDVTNALQRLSTAEGKITTFDSDISKLKTDTGTLTTKTESLETSLGDKVDVTTFNEVSDTVDQHSQSITQMSQTLSNKADGSTVTALTTRVSKTEQDITGINTTIGELSTTVESKADGSTVDSVSNKLNTVSDTVDGHTQSISSINSTLETKADSSTVSSLTTKVNNVSNTVDGHTQTIGSIESTQTTMQGKLDKTIVETTQLWYTKANDTAPSKPTSKVTSTSVSGNAWRTVVPTYSASYPYYFYCYQYELADGTYTWSDVVYDRATTENQSNSRSAVSGVSTLTTKTNEISDTVDGHTSQLSSITTTQTSIQGSAVKSTVQLWFTKANTTAPSKPTAHVTTNSASTANAWNLAVPTYNASYPYYYYCYEHQLLNDTYTWSAVTRDMATEESQSTSRSAASAAAAADTKAGNAATAAATADGKAVSAQNTANKNVRESQQLWYTKANSTAPAKPTSKVTSTATTGGAWTTRVPTYSDSYKHYFYCMQYVAADGTVTWSDVIYDQATTEAQSVARAASADLTEFHQEYATFKQTTQEFESTVGETYATKAALETTDGEVSGLTTRMSTAESSITQNARDITFRATKDEVEKTYSTKEDSQLDRAGSGTSVTVEGAANAALKSLHILGESVQDGTPTPDAPVPIVSVGGANLSPFFEIPVNHVAYWFATGNLTTYGTTLEDGWVHLENCTVNLNVSPLWTALRLKPNTTYTVMFETRNGTYPSSAIVARIYAASNSPWASGVSTNIYEDGTYYVTGSTLSDVSSSAITHVRTFFTCSTSAPFTGDLRVSIYEGVVSRPYVPYDNLGVRVLGKNLFHQTRYSTTSTSAGITWSFGEDGIITADGTATNVSWALARSSSGVSDDVASYTYIDAGTYTASVGGGGLSWALVYLNDSRTRVTIKGVSAVDYYTFTIDEPRLVSVVPVVPNGTTVSALTFYPQIEKGPEATEYEPYSGTVTPIPLDGHELRSLPDGTQDELTVDTDGHVTMTQRVGSVTFDGSSGEVWADKSTTTSGKPSHVVTVADLIDGSPLVADDGGTVYGFLVCNRFPEGSDSGTSTGTYRGITGVNVRRSSAHQLTFYLNGESLSEFKTWLASNDTTVIYPLATPQTIDLGTIDMPQVKDGDTVEVIAALTPSIDVTWWASAGQAVADAYASLSSAIEVRAESIVSTVSERYATSQEVQAISSQIEQTAQSWTAQFNELTGGADLSMTLAEAFDALGVTSANLEQIRSFVRITTDSNGDPLLLMGSASSPIMLALSNDSLRFMHGSDPVAYIDVDGTTNEGRLHITRAVVVKELQFGSWKWFERDNGNMALKWVGDE